MQVGQIHILWMMLATLVQSWGDIGHRTIATLAERTLSQQIIQKYQEFIGSQSGTLADIAIWADQAKLNPAWRWTSRLHHATTEPWKCSFRLSRDCPADQCVVGAIANFTQRLGLRASEPSYWAPGVSSDLALLIHLVGDLVQPLHVGFLSDRGGNRYRGLLCEYQSNLHAIWDGHLLRRRIRSDFNDDLEAFLVYLEQHMSPKTEPLCDVQEPLISCLERWASDSAWLACQFAYTDEKGIAVQSGFNLCDAYYEHTIDIIEQQLILGGSRLAFLLEVIFGDLNR